MNDKYERHLNQLRADGEYSYAFTLGCIETIATSPFAGSADDRLADIVAVLAAHDTYVDEDRRRRADERARRADERARRAEVPAS